METQETRQLAWSKFGTKLVDAKTSIDALQQAGLHWKVAQSPVQWMEVDGTLHSSDWKQVNYREDTGDLLGVVGSGYTVVQNEEAFAFSDLLCYEGVQYEQAGSVKGGRQVWMLAKMPERKILQDAVSCAFFSSCLFTSGAASDTVP